MAVEKKNKPKAMQIICAALEEESERQIQAAVAEAERVAREKYRRKRDDLKRICQILLPMVRKSRGDSTKNGTRSGEERLADAVLEMAKATTALRE